MSTSTTGLLPIDPAVSPQQVARILSIRANLLPPEILAVRNARRIRIGLIGTMVVVIALLGAWYAYALAQKATADDNLAGVTAEATLAQQKKASHNQLTSTIAQSETISEQLKGLLADDLPWSTTIDRVGTAAAKGGITIQTMTASLTDKPATGATTTGDSAGTLVITGMAKDKKTAANFVDALGGLSGLTNAFLTTVANDAQYGVTFTATVMITTKALCGRFTTPCKAGGK